MKQRSLVRPELQAHMKMRLEQNRERGLTKAELWFLEDYLSKFRLKWCKQRLQGVRIFDFFNHYLGVAIEVDGREHDKVKDAESDRLMWENHRIIVLRVRNWNRLDAEDCLEMLRKLDTWRERRLAAGMGPTSMCKTRKMIQRGKITKDELFN